MRAKHLVYIAEAIGVLLLGLSEVRSQGIRNLSPHGTALHSLVSAMGAPDSTGTPVKCGFPLIASAWQHRAELPAGAEAALSVLDTRPVLETSVLLGIFRIHFDTSTTNAPALLDGAGQKIPGTARAFADSVGAILAHVFDVEINQLGYDAPLQDGSLGGGPEYDIYVTNLGSYGYTDFDQAIVSGGTSTTFIVIDNSFSWVSPAVNRGLPALRVTLAHEFHHMVQVGRYGYWFSNQWFYELTSTWLEDVVYTDVNDYYNYLNSSSGQFSHPEVPLTESSGILMYSRCILGTYLAKAYGTEAMKRTWETIRQEPPLPALMDVLPAAYSTSFTDGFGLWNAWNAYTNTRADQVKYYPEGAAYPLIKETLVDLGMLANRTVSSAVGSPAARYFRCIAGTDTVFLAFSYAGTVADAGTSSIPFSFIVSRTQEDASFRKTSSGLYLSYSLPSPNLWTVWELGSSSPTSPQSTQPGSPFPNPFMPPTQGEIHFPTTEIAGILTIYTIDMVRVYEGAQQSRSFLGRSGFAWDGRGIDGNVVPSGVYLYVISVGNSRTVGKFAVVRK
jgi:hypothetical protein